MDSERRCIQALTPEALEDEVIIRGEGSEVRTKFYQWCNVLALAMCYGGEMAEQDTTPTSYSDDEAATLAQALLHALPDLPDHDATAHLRGPDGSWTREPSFIEVLSGEGRHLASMVGVLASCGPFRVVFDTPTGEPDNCRVS